MNNRRVERMVQLAAGSIKEIVGKIAGNKRAEFEGRAQKEQARARVAAARARELARETSGK
jgi:uncharacterized protein YjbJ (UPF0337 family)